MVRNPLKDVMRLFFPAICPVCGERMAAEGEVVCTRCQLEIPLTGFCRMPDNPVARKFYGNLPVENASSFFFFVHESGYRSLIHKFKYAGKWGLAEKMGRWYGEHLRQSGLYDGIDVVVPIPLHVRKLLKRGYNQSEYLARGIAAALGKPMERRSVARTKYNESQTLRSREQRWDNVRGIFSVRRPQALAGRHILLVDDVLTTGATLISCGETILGQAPDCRISIVTLAVSRDES